MEVDLLRNLARASRKAQCITDQPVHYAEVALESLDQLRIDIRREQLERETHALERDDVEVLLLGETREWETVEYAADAATQGKRKALIVIGHIPSEQAGMEECTRWLQTFVTGVKIEFVPAKQPFWLPK